ncbi:hypothetical protein [Methylobacterium nodulans]|uniref:DUF2946 domain-containing protein n=1 Tax=Methylobacterium nodulans (strain LMG 21967 / CNCM I-2342 / ORS 2060) TaxID=460265 RepID=B8IKU6_METNO|nr:conserved hypothetical protein [Methylobacterium nodulans ORS 2060]
MRAPPHRWPILRAVIAVAALYALALQAVAGGFLAAEIASPAHILCAPGPEAPEGPKPDPVHGHMACCTAAQDLAGATPPLPASTAIVWPRRPALAVAWRPETVAHPRAPPRTGTSARAPPVV